MKVLIVDDEEKARSLLRAIVTDFCPEVTELKEAEDLPEAVKHIRSFEPEIVFLDIEMPAYSGTQILDFFEPSEVTFHIIFTTAYSEYAVKAFEMNAVDYLLKPLRPKQVKESVKKVMEQNVKSDFQKQLVELKETFKHSEFSKIGLPVADGLLFMELDDIISMEADGMYTRVFSTSASCQIVSKPLKYFVDMLKGNAQFYRPHRSFYINIKHIKQFVRRDGNYIIMDNDHLISVSKEKKDEFLEIVNSI